MKVHVLSVHDFQILLKIQLPNTVTSNQSDFLAFLPPVHVFCLTSTEISPKYSYFTLHEQRKSPEIQLIEKTLYDIEFHELQF